MDERLIKQLRLLKQYTDILFTIRLKTKEDYLRDDILRGAAERYLQLSIESCINIGNRIISLEQFNQNILVPESYADIFKIMADIQILDKCFSQTLMRIAKFRNKLVHAYWNIDDDYVYDLLHNHLEDFVQYMTIISAYIKDHST